MQWKILFFYDIYTTNVIDICMQFIQNQGFLINVSFNNHIEASVSMD